MSGTGGPLSSLVDGSRIISCSSPFTFYNILSVIHLTSCS